MGEEYLSEQSVLIAAPRGERADETQDARWEKLVAREMLIARKTTVKLARRGNIVWRLPKRSGGIELRLIRAIAELS